MKDYPLTSRQIMMSSEDLVYELGLVSTPKEIENNKIISYLLLGGLTVVTIGIMIYSLNRLSKEKKMQNKNT
jgi:hypothetical protein